MARMARVASKQADPQPSGVGEKAALEAFRDPLWRLGNLYSIRTRHGVPLENIKGHADVDERTFRCGGGTYKTKVDPGANFPWARIRSALGGRPRLLSEPKPVPRRAAAQPAMQVRATGP